MLVTLDKVLPRARVRGYAVGAFNINNLETLQGVISACEEEHVGAIVQTSEGALAYGGMEYLAALVHAAAKKTRVPLVFHLDHGKDVKLVKKVIASGLYTSVMFDGSALHYQENIRITRDLARHAHARSMSIEAELGVIKGAEDKVHARASDFTDPSQAAEFAAKTNCDALAVSIGTSHGAYKFSGTPHLDIARLEEIARVVKAPLVLHGASGVDAHMLDALHEKCAQMGDCERLSGAQGVPSAEIKKAIAHGVAKINIDSDLRMAFTAAVRRTFLEDTKMFDPRVYLGAGREAVKQVVKEKIRIFGTRL